MDLVRRSLKMDSSRSPQRCSDQERRYYKKDDKIFTTEIEVRNIQKKILRPPTPRDLRYRVRNNLPPNAAPLSPKK